MRFLLVATGLLNTIILSLFDPVPTPKDVSFSTPPNSVEVYDILELSATISSPDATNPFTAATLEGDFSLASTREVFHVSGFCDSTDGATFRIRFMPSKPGTYNFTLVYTQAAFTKTFRGEFRATPSHRRGPIRIDPQYPWHFIWEGTGEHYFFNGTTAYWLLGWKDDHVVQYSIERLHRLKARFGGRGRSRSCQHHSWWAN